MYDKTAEREM